MPRRPKDPLLARLKTLADWDRFLLKTYGLPQESRSDLEKGEHLFVNRDTGQSMSVEEIPRKKGQADFPNPDLQKAIFTRETAADESIHLSPEWERYFGLICVITDALLPETQRQGAKDAALQQCRLGSVQKDAPPPIPADLGTPEELRRRWRRGEIEMRAVPPANRQEHVIEIREYFVPEEPEDSDDEPEGYWEGLKWRRHKPGRN
jgi:hypothetical protein